MFAALAVSSAAVASTAAAQSNVQIYGRVNTSIEHHKVGGNSVTAMVNNNSRFGFRGEEDLGNGMKVGFALESGFKSDSGEGMTSGGGLSFGRKSQVYLKGGFGKLQMGRAGGSSYDYVADYGVLDQPNHDTGTVSDALYQGVGRSTNGISYSTPNMHGLVVEAAMSMHEKASAGKNDNSYDLSANWELGQWSLGAGYTDKGEDEQWGVRVHYTDGPYQVGAFYQRVEADAMSSACNNAGQACGSRNMARINAMYTQGASEFVVGYGWTDDWSGVANSSAQQLMLGYNFNLSKRTKAYALYTKYLNDANVKYGYGFSQGVNFGQDAQAMGVGLRHAF